jgi:hypothetical protein
VVLIDHLETIDYQPHHLATREHGACQPDRDQAPGVRAGLVQKFGDEREQPWRQYRAIGPDGVEQADSQSMRGRHDA